MKEVLSFISRYGLSPKEIDVYIASLQLGDASVATIARRANIKRPSTYLVLEGLVKRGLVDIMKTRRGAHYRPLNPKRIASGIELLQKEYESALPTLTGAYRDKKHKPVVSVHEDYQVYDRIADEVREYVQSGKEALYFGNSEFFYQKPAKVDLWFKVMKNKRCHCREIICGDGPTQKACIKQIRALGNPNYQVKNLKNPTHPVHTEFGIWKDTVYLFSGSGKEMYTIITENSALANTQRVVFEQIWESLPGENQADKY